MKTNGTEIKPFVFVELEWSTFKMNLAWSSKREKRNEQIWHSVVHFRWKLIFTALAGAGFPSQEHDQKKMDFTKGKVAILM